MSWMCKVQEYTNEIVQYNTYRVASISRLLKIIGLFCKRAL